MLRIINGVLDKTVVLSGIVALVLMGYMYRSTMKQIKKKLAEDQEEREQLLQHQNEIGERFYQLFKEVEQYEPGPDFVLEKRENYNGAFAIFAGYRADDESCDFITPDIRGHILAQVFISLDSENPPIHLVYGSSSKDEYYGAEEDTVNLVLGHLCQGLYQSFDDEEIPF